MSEVMMQKENHGKASHGSEFALGIITEQAMAERGSVQARLRSTKWMEVSFFFATDGKDACGGESWSNDQGKEQSWKEFRDGGSASSKNVW